MRFMSNIGSSSLLVFMSVLVFGISDVHAFPLPDYDVYVLAERFTWREFDNTGRQIVKESGPRYGWGGAFVLEFQNHLSLRPRAEFNAGDVDYSGQTKAGKQITTTASYTGGKFEMDLGGRIRLWGAVLEPFAGFGARIWFRMLDDSIAADGSTAYGYSERWRTSYGRLGVRGEVSFGQEKNSIFLLAGLKLPRNTTNYINNSAVSSSGLTLNPRNEPSFFAEAGVKLDHIKINAFYDTMRFKESPVYKGFIQPRTKSDMLGVRIGGSF